MAVQLLDFFDGEVRLGRLFFYSLMHLLECERLVVQDEINKDDLLVDNARIRTRSLERRLCCRTDERVKNDDKNQV